MRGVRLAALGGLALLGLLLAAPTGAADSPNLVVTDLEVVPTDPVGGDPVHFPATIANDGDAPSEPFTVRWILDDARFDEREVDSLDPGESVTVTTRNWTAEAGDHTIKAIADVYKSNDEPTRTDNVLRRTFSVDPPRAPRGPVEVLNTTLPEAREGAGAVTWDGVVHVVGGVNGTGVGGDDPKAILVLDPSEENVTEAGAQLPSPLRDAAVVAADDAVYVLGGEDTGGLEDEILVYHPDNGSVERTGDTLPSPRCCGDAVWNGTHVLYVGGSDASGPLDEVVAWAPDGNGARVLDATLPQPRAGVRAIWDGRDLPNLGCGGGCAYVLGGADVDGSQLRSILRVHPATGEVDPVSGRLPVNGSVDGAAFWDGKYGYVVGGADPPDHLRRIVRYDPITDVTQVRPAEIPTGRHGLAAAWTGEAAYAFGGRTEVGTLDEVLRYEPGKPDLSLVNLSLRPSPPPAGEDVRLRAVVSNVGEVAASNVTVSFRVDGARVSSATFASLDVDRTLRVSSEPWEATSGRHEAFARTFLEGPDEEVTRENNERKLNFTVNERPLARFSVGVDGLNVTVNASASSDPDGAVAAYAWDWGDDSRSEGGPLNAHRYDEAGNYTITLRVTDDAGATGERSRSVAPNTPPVASFEVQVRDRTVLVDASASEDPDGSPIETYRWDWGDNSSRTQGVRTNHTYEEIGIYTVTLTVRDALGGEATTLRDVEVWGPIPGPGALLAVGASLVAAGLRARRRR